MEVWVVASAIGANLSAEDAAKSDPWPDDAPAMINVRRQVALREGRTPPGIDDLIDADEYRRLREEVRK